MEKRMQANAGFQWKLERREGEYDPARANRAPNQQSAEPALHDQEPRSSAAHVSKWPGVVSMI